MARRRQDGEQTRNLILDAVERLMRKEGYAGVNTRSVALEAGIKPPLVHYHFDTTENLLLASYRRSAGRSAALLAAAVESDRPLRALWKYNADSDRTVLATQFLALANERPVIGEEMARNVSKFRTLQSEALQATLKGKSIGSGLTPDAVAMLIAALGRAFVMEGSIGITQGHDDMRTVVERFLDMVEPL